MPAQVRQLGRRQRRPDRLQFLGRVLEGADPLGDPGDEGRDGGEEDAADRDRQAEVRDRLYRAADRVEADAGQRDEKCRAEAEPPGREPDRHRVEEGEAGGGAAGEDPGDEDDCNRGDDPGDARGSR